MGGLILSPSPYIQCLVCGRLTPVDRGICYHCHSPLPSRVALPPGMIVCPNCLKITPVNSGYCRHCRAPLPIHYADENSELNQPNPDVRGQFGQEQVVYHRRRGLVIGALGNLIRIGAYTNTPFTPRRLRIVRRVE